MGMAATIPYYTVEDLEQFPDDGNRYELLDGVLLVTPAPGVRHELVVSRIVAILVSALQIPGHALVFGRGAVSLPPRTQLEPDVLVVGARMPRTDKWADISERWLAVEVFSRSSRVYDREFKRDAYLALGVSEVWLVDKEDRSVEVSRERGRTETVRDVIDWRVPTLDLVVQVGLREVFVDLDG